MQRTTRKEKKHQMREVGPSPFLDPRGAMAAATKSLGLLGPFRAALLVDVDADGCRKASCCPSLPWMWMVVARRRAQ